MILDCKMVPGKGTESNSEVTDLTTPEQSLNPETCRELFDTLARWNDYLENHVPYFSEHSEKPQEPEL